MARDKDNSEIPTSPSTGPVAAATSRAKKIIGTAKRAVSGAQPGETAPADTIGPEFREKLKAEEILRELERLYSPEAFEPIVKAPSNLMSMLTGRKLWELSNNESKALATSASVTAKYFMPTDPKMVALVMFAGSVLTIYGTRVGLHIREINEEKKAKKNESSQTA